MAEEKNTENNSGLGATGNFIHSYIQEDLKGELNKIHRRVDFLEGKVLQTENNRASSPASYPVTGEIFL